MGYPHALGGWDGHVAVAFGGLDAHQHRLLALVLGAIDLGLHVLRRRNRLARDIENDVAGGQAFGRSRAVRVDAGDRNALVSSACDLLRRGDLDPQRRRGPSAIAASSALATVSFFWSASVDLRRLLGAVAQVGEIDLGARLERADAQREVGRVVDLFAVQLRDDVARLEAGLGGWSSGHDLIDDRPGCGFHAQTVGHRLGHGLNVDAEIATRNDPAVLERVDHALGDVGGMAKPMPTEPPVGEKIAVLTPITRP